jgi:hypothetical protein
MKYGVFSWLSWFFAIVSLLSLSLELISRAPSPTGSPVLPESAPKLNVQINKNCCVSSFFDNSEIENILFLGYSLRNLGVIPPKTFAFAKNELTEENKNKLAKYFDIVAEGTKATKELLDGCFPLISVSSLGVFNKSPWDICNFATKGKMPAAVPLQGDIVYPDKAMIVFDPSNMRDPIFTMHGEYKGSLDKWFNLPSEFSVLDYENDFLDFWMSFSSPTYIHYSKSTFQEIVSGSKKPENGSFRIFRVLKQIYSNYMK